MTSLPAWARHDTSLFPFDAELYRLRNLIEQTFCRLKDSWAIATRYGPTAESSRMSTLSRTVRNSKGFAFLSGNRTLPGQLIKCPEIAPNNGFSDNSLADGFADAATVLFREDSQSIARLTAIIKELQRHRFGARSEKIDADQLALMLEDLEQTLAAATAEAEKKQTGEQREARRKRRINRGALPAHLPREEIVVDVADKSCPCCKGLRHVIGEDVSERLDVTPARFKVIVTRRPKYACRSCEGEVTQAPAQERLIEGGVPTEALVARGRAR